MVVVASKSIPKSKLLTVSTLFSPIISINATLPESIGVLDLISVVVVIPVSAKFLNPVVCKSLFTGFCKSSHRIGLLTVYDKFW